MDNFIKEGKARILSGEKTFYNPVQEFNRDLSVAALKVFVEFYADDLKPRRAIHKRKNTASDSEGDVQPGMQQKKSIRVLEALAATGLRSIRYALEVPGITEVIANDCSHVAVETMENNIKENGVQNIVKATQHDAVWLMQKLNFENRPVSCIDLDPYGCPTRFLDSAINCIEDGGLLMVTCTDLAILAGNTPESCFVKYGAVSLRSAACHEMALRIVLQCIANCCGKYGKYITPMLSLSADFYIRVFVRIFCGQQICKETSSKVSMVYQCKGCESFRLQPLGCVEEVNKKRKFSLPVAIPVSECNQCGHKHKIGGPIWSGRIHDKKFVERMLALIENHSDDFATSRRMIGVLTVIKEELEDAPLYYITNSLCGIIHCGTIPARSIRSALLNGGYEVSLSHCKGDSIKTNAPPEVIWDILRCWVKSYPVNEKRLQNNSIAAAILSKDTKFVANFKIHEDAVPNSALNGLLRFQMNPLPYWGPGMRSRSNVLANDISSRRKRNQNKCKNRQFEESSINTNSDREHHSDGQEQGTVTS